MFKFLMFVQFISPIVPYCLKSQAVSKQIGVSMWVPSAEEMYCTYRKSNLEQIAGCEVDLNY